MHDGKRERELLLVERLVVGRDPACDISVDDGLLSRRHAEFVAAASAVTVRDLGSRNGIFVNGTRRAEQTLEARRRRADRPAARAVSARPRALAAEASARMDADGTLMIPATAPAQASLRRPAPLARPSIRSAVRRRSCCRRRRDSKARRGSSAAARWRCAAGRLPADGRGCDEFLHGALASGGRAGDADLCERRRRPAAPVVPAAPARSRHRRPRARSS